MLWVATALPTGGRGLLGSLEKILKGFCQPRVVKIVVLGYKEDILFPASVPFATAARPRNLRKR